jgi:hypothetical protein
LGKAALSWPIQAGRHYYFLLTAKERLIQTRPVMIERLLKALVAAEHFFRTHEALAYKMLEEGFKLDRVYLQSVRNPKSFQVRLDEALLILMDDEAQWIINNKLTDKREVPNYLESIYIQGLERIKPEAISILR